MSNESYSVDYEGGAPKQSGESAQMQQAAAQPFPFQFVAPPKKRFLSAGVGMVCGVILCAAAFYAAEMIAPVDYRPSTFTGTYSGRYTAEIRAHELETQAEFEDWAAEVRVSAEQQQEQYRAIAQSVLQNYQATYDRTKIFADATARLQQTYVQQSMDVTRSQQGMDVTVVNFARLFGRLAGLADPELGQSAIDYADAIGGQLQSELDRTVTNGVTVDVEGWDIDLASPGEVQQVLQDIPPVTFPDPPSISRDAAETE
jgi:hypothetical protein